MYHPRITDFWENMRLVLMYDMEECKARIIWRTTGENRHDTSDRPYENKREMVLKIFPADLLADAPG